MGLVTKSLWNYMKNEAVGIPAGTDRMLYAPVPGVDLVTQCKSTSIDALFSGGAIGDLVATGHAAIGPDALLDGEDVYGSLSFQIINIAEIITNQVSGSGRFWGGNSILHVNPAPLTDYTSSDVFGWGVGVNVPVLAVGDIQSITGLRAMLTHQGDNSVGVLTGISVSEWVGGGSGIGNIIGIKLDLERFDSDVVNYTSIYGIVLDNYVAGGLHIGVLVGFWVTRPDAVGAIITNAIGIEVDDFSALGSTQSYNILSKGAASLNVFEGTVQADQLECPGTSGHTLILDTAAAAPASAGLAALAPFYGGAGKLLGDPTQWALVKIGGVEYKVPAYA